MLVGGSVFDESKRLTSGLVLHVVVKNGMEHRVVDNQASVVISLADCDVRRVLLTWIPPLLFVPAAGSSAGLLPASVCQTAATLPQTLPAGWSYSLPTAGTARPAPAVLL